MHHPCCMRIMRYGTSSWAEAPESSESRILSDVAQVILPKAQGNDDVSVGLARQ